MPYDNRAPTGAPLDAWGLPPSSRRDSEEMMARWAAANPNQTTPGAASRTSSGALAAAWIPANAATANPTG